jgi:hypothetical protein
MVSLNLELIFSKIYFLIKGIYIYVWSVFSLNPVYILILKISWGVLAIFLSLVMAYLAYLIFHQWQEDRENMLSLLVTAWREGAEDKVSQDWENIISALESDNPADWKLAIIEADTMLDAMVANIGYKGGNLGERLKMIEPSDFLTLNDAWEAHKVRNAIAHEGGYELNKRETQRVIGLYEKVFREFRYI